MFCYATLPTVSTDIQRAEDEVGRLFAAAMRHRPLEQSDDALPINLSVGETGAHLTALLPGVSQENLEISIMDRDLTLSGRRPVSSLPADQVWLRREHAEGKFVRALRLPFRIDADAVKASLKDGVLELTLAALGRGYAATDRRLSRSPADA